MRRLPTTFVFVVILCAAISRLSADVNDAQTSPALRAANPRSLSGGLYSALTANGALGGLTPASRARAGGIADLSKGKPPAVLDARVGVNVRLGDDPVALPATQRGQAEPHIARSLANPDLLLATFQEGRFAVNGGSVDCGYALSKDGGLSWTRALVPKLTTASSGSYHRATDPVAAVGPQGDLYLATLVSLDDAFGSADLVVSRSTDSGATWLAPAIVFHQTTPLASPDKDWLVVNDLPGTPNAGRLVATWTNFTANAAGASTGSNLLAAVSDDRGATWSAPVPITPAGSFNQGTQPLFLPDGSLAVIYVTFTNPANVTSFAIQCKRSTDGGRTFPAAATTAVSAVNGYDDPDLRGGVFLPSAAVSHISGEIFVTYTAVVSGSPRVMFTKSSDQGTTWATPVIASDNPAGASVMNPAIAVTPVVVSPPTVVTPDHILSIVFMDKRNAPDRHNFVDCYAAMSFDDGATWQPNLRLSEMSSDIRYAPLTSEGYMLGDYLGLAPAVEIATQTTQVIEPGVALWCDTRTGDSDPFSVRFMTGTIPNNPDDWTYARFTRDEIAGVTAAGGGAGAGADPDGDGYENLLEFILGTDPRKAESGEALLTRIPAPGMFDVIWTERESLSPSQIYSVGVNQAARFGASAFPSVELTAEQMPAVVPTVGLRWRGLRFSTLGKGPFFANFVHNLRGSLVPTGAQATSGTDSRLINLSTRGPIRPGNGPMIAGFVTRDGPRSLLIRGVGPSLSQFGVATFAADPSLVLLKVGDAVISAQNDDWQSGGPAASNLLTITGAQVGAFPFRDVKDAALFVSGVPVANYSAQVSNRANSIGTTGLVEIYDASPNADGRLVNLSTRGEVSAPENTLTAGFVINGTQPRRVLLRAVGPSLAQFGTSGFLTDPVLTLYDSSGRTLASNDDWEISRSSAALAATAQNVGAFVLNSASLDSALLLTLAPGAYTAVVTGANGATGTVLVEVYDAN